MPSSDESAAPRRIAVIGGGVSGLAAAQQIVHRSPGTQLSLFEAGPRLGGVLGTTYRDGYLLERSADMFTTREPWAVQLCERLGIADQLIGTNNAQRRAFVVFRGQLVEVPEGFTLMSPAKISSVLKTPLLSWRGKLRLASELFVRPRTSNDDESLTSFVTRRFGQEAFDRLIQPLIGGIYTADPAKLSLMATLPQFLEMERQHGSVIRATRRQQRASKTKETSSGARYGLFVAPRQGMQTLVDALAAALPAGSVHLNTPVERLTPQLDGSWIVQTPNRPPQTFDGVILATRAQIAGRLLMATSPALASDLSHIAYAGAALVMLGVRREQVEHPLDGFGFVVPMVEKRRILAGSFSSIKFAGRAPDGCVLLRAFVGGAIQPELLEREDAELAQMAQEELRELIGLHGEPQFCEVSRWIGAMPQYHVGHLQIVKTIEERAALLPNFALAGNAYRGVGIPFCIRSGQQAADHVLDSLHAFAEQAS
jgi:oxygen-dependent protoporphyrinogen oxidase